MTNDGNMHKNNGRRGLSTTTMQMRLLSTRTMTDDVVHNNDENDGAKHMRLLCK